MKGLEYEYERIDGSISGNKRQDSIDRFNGLCSFIVYYSIIVISTHMKSHTHTSYPLTSTITYSTISDMNFIVPFIGKI